MKPTKNRFFCNDCRKIKMLFETEKKAENFIKFNSETIEEETGLKPERSYFCIACNGWHLTRKKEVLNIKSKTEIIQDLYRQEKEQKALAEEKQKALKKEQKELVKAQEIASKKAQEKEQKELIKAKKREQIALIQAQKMADFKHSLGLIELYITMLENFKPDKNKSIEILSEAFRELENAKSIRVVFKKSKKMVENAAKKLNSMSKEINNAMK
jgi:hypothetical protein